MRYVRCRCGKSEGWGELPQCSKCDACGSDLAGSPSSHGDPKPHEYTEYMVETDEGPKPLSRCRFCLQTKARIEKIEGKPS